MKLFWLTIGLTILWSQFATAQIGLQPPEPRTQIETDETREYWIYNYHIRWEGAEVLETDSVLNITYDFMRVTVFIYTDIKPDSVSAGYLYGDGLQEYGRIQWRKGYNVGIKEDDTTNLERIFYGFCGAAIVFGIITTVDIMRN